MFPDSDDWIDSDPPPPVKQATSAVTVAVGSAVALAAVLGLAWGGVYWWRTSNDRAALAEEVAAARAVEADTLAALREGRKANTLAEWRALLVGKGSHQLVAWFGPPDRIPPRTAESEPGIWVYLRLKVVPTDGGPAAVGLTVEVKDGVVIDVQ
jgi:hypothetical protein